MTEIQEAERGFEIPVMEFPERLWLAMKRRHIGALEMAERLEVARQSLSNWLQGHTRPRPRDVKALARECRVPYEWLAHGITPDQIGELDQSSELPDAALNSRYRARSSKTSRSSDVTADKNSSRYTSSVSNDTAYYKPSLNDLEALATSPPAPARSTVDPTHPRPELAAFRTEIKSWWKRDVRTIAPTTTTEYAE